MYFHDFDNLQIFSFGIIFFLAAIELIFSFNNDSMIKLKKEQNFMRNIYETINKGQNRTAYHNKVCVYYDYCSYYHDYYCLTNDTSSIQKRTKFENF